MHTYIAYILANLYTVFSTGTSEHFFCAHDHLRNHDQAYQADSVEYELGWLSYQESRGMQEGGAASYVIPVVFHIIHNNGRENISANQVQNALEWLNESMANTGYYDPAIGVDTDIQFCLAKQDPSGNATDGIVRRQSRLTTFNYNNQDLDLKNLSRWDPNDYLNIWVVQEIISNQGSGVAGYAYFPTSHGSDVDGVVVEARYTGTSESDNAILTHEVGHYLGLFHTFQGGCTNNDCQLDGDKICDTPPDGTTNRPPCDQPNNSCRTDVNSGWTTDQNDMISNYMDYSDLRCYNQFTSRQALRMQYSLDVVRRSLLESIGCEDPCPMPVFASANFGQGPYLVGDRIDFVNQSINAARYSWKVNGSEESQMADFSWVFPTQGIYEIRLDAQGSDSQCRDDTTWIFDVECEAQADFLVNKKELVVGEAFLATNQSQRATSYQWFIDGIQVSTSEDYGTSFPSQGIYELMLVVGNGLCKDTGDLILLTVREMGPRRRGLPQWPITRKGAIGLDLLDWRDPNPMPTSITNILNEGVGGTTGAAFDECGGLKFVVVHPGNSEPTSMFIYAPDGRALLDNMVNAPGLNAVRGRNELQVVPVPNRSSEWYIIYNEYLPDNSWPANNAQYAAVRILYSRVAMPGDQLIVLDRDVLLTANGTAYTYTDGKAVSRTAQGRSDLHYLYATRRTWQRAFLSVDRWIIGENGISFDKNTGEVPAEWWDLCLAGSPVELSPTEDRVAIVNRNQERNQNDIVIFNTDRFDVSSSISITLGELNLKADGATRDVSSILPRDVAVRNIASLPSVPLQFLTNLERKVSVIEFSPNGRFLYFGNGGYAGQGVSNLTYLGQIDLHSSYPFDLRLQIQTTPNGTFDPFTGAGCRLSNSQCANDFRNINRIESSYDGNLYYGKRGGNFLYVIAEPDDFMPQNLVPSEIDLSSTSEPNVFLGFELVFMPDQIDGFEYLNFSKQEIEIIIQKLDCDSMCLASYPVVITDDSPDGISDTFWMTTCPDTLEICVDTNYSYWLEDLRTDSIIQIVEPGARILPRLATDGLDLSERSGCIEICGNGEDDDGDGLIDCDDPDIQNDCCCLEPEEVDLGPDVGVCDNGVQVIDAGAGFAIYRWQDGFDQQVYTAFEPGLYWVEVEDTCGNRSSDSLIIEIIQASILDLGPDTMVCEGTLITFYRNPANAWKWYESDVRGCNDCDSMTFRVDSNIILIAEQEYGLGCFSIDSIEVSIVPAPKASDTIWLCPEDTVDYRGRIVTDTLDFEMRLSGSTTCDTILKVVVLGRGEYQQAIELEVCPGDSAMYRGSNYGPGEYVFLTSTGNECDSVTYLTVVQMDTLTLIMRTDSICWDKRGGSIELTLPQGSNPEQIRWNTGATGVLSITDLDTGTYFVEVLGENGCISKRSIQLPAFHRPRVKAYGRDLFCGDSTSGRIEWNPQAFPSLIWNGEVYRSGEIQNVPLGAHHVEMITRMGCVIDTMLNIEEGLDFKVMARDIDTVRFGDSLNLSVLPSGSGGYMYRWIPCENLSCCDCPNPVFNGTSSTYYRVIVTDSLGCEKILRMRVLVELNKRIFVPNAITPNDDKINDRLTIFGNWAVEEIPILEIYDRWGELIYRGTNQEPNNVDQGWDATFQGEPVLPGVYTYKAQVRFVDGTEWRSGSVTVLR